MIARSILFRLAIVAISAGLVALSHAASPDSFTPGSQTLNGQTVPYQLFTPTNYNASSATKYPLVIYLHGVGSRGTDNVGQLGSGMVNKFISSSLQQTNPCFVLVPQCPGTSTWTSSNIQPLVKSIVDSMVTTYRIDPDRLYLCGWSMGGIGTQGYLGSFPGFFAAGMPCAGSGDVSQVENMSRSAIWFSHGALDPAVTISGSRDPVAALNNSGNTVLTYKNTVANINAVTDLDRVNLLPAKFVFTEYTDGAHVDGQRALTENPLMPLWLFSKNRATLPGSVTSYAITASAGLGGTVSPVGINRYTANALVSLTATANPGYIFSGWSGSASGTSNPLTITPSADQTITANFIGVPATGRILTWNALNATWDLSSANWSIAGGGGVAYIDGDAVRFDDTASTSAVNLGLTLSPPSIGVNNNALNYTLSGGGLLAGAGTLLKDGPGLLVLAVSNEMSGGTTINNGTLQVGNGGTSGGLGSGNVTNNAVLSFNRSDNFTVTCAISGSGALIKTNSGSLTLSGNHSYAGPTTVSAGTLLVNGDSSGAAGAVTVASAATLGGGGKIGGNVILAQGALATNNFINTLMISGSLTLNNNTLFVSTPEASGPGDYPLMTYRAAGSSGSFNPIPVLSGLGLAPNTIGTIVTSNGAVTLHVVSTFTPPVTWTNSWTVGTSTAGTANWSSLSIWVGGVVPGSGVGDAINFVAPGNNATVVNDFAPVTLGSMSFAARPGKNYTLSGSHAFTFYNQGNGASLTNSSSETTARVTFNTPIALADNLVVTNNATTTGLIVLTGIISESGGSRSLTVAAGAIGGTGGVTLSGVNTYTGTTTVASGKLSLGSAGTIASPSLVIAAGATFDTSAKSTFTMPNTQTFTFGIDPTGLGRSARINAAGLTITNAKVSFATSGLLDDSVYVLASYTSRIGAAFAVATPPAGYAIDYAYASGTQIALVQTLSGYALWAISNAGGEAANLDTDKDGVANGVEYFMNSGPGFTANPPLVTSGAARTVTWVNGGNIPSSAYGSRYVVQISADLGIWTDVPLGNVTNTSGSVTYTVPVGTTRNFVRLSVAGN